MVLAEEVVKLEAEICKVKLEGKTLESWRGGGGGKMEVESCSGVEGRQRGKGGGLSTL